MPWFARTAGAAALASFAWACAAVSGLNAYKSGDCSGNCNAGGDGEATDDGTLADGLSMDSGVPASGDSPAQGSDTAAADRASDGQSPCVSGFISCNGVCIDSASASNCGACGNVCTGSTPICASMGGVYACTSSCPPSSATQCAGSCVNTSTDPNNCGSCGHTCTTSLTQAQPACLSGACGVTCSSGYNLCNGACVDYASAQNCGSCGNACGASTPACAASTTDAGNSYACVASCPAAMPTFCSGSCVDTTSDAKNCNTCGNTCSTTVAHATPVCVNKACTFACQTGYTSCSGACVVLTTASNCGACGNACSGGTPVCAVSGGDGGMYSCVSGCPSSTPTLCGSSCVDTQTDVNNCGTCGTVCSTGVANATPACVSSVCSFKCNSGYTACNGACVNEQIDPNNCGGCGAAYACTGGGMCSAGVCCTQIALPPSVNVDATQWASAFKTSPTWNCSASGTTTVDSAAATVSGDTCGGTATLDATNNVAQSVSGGPNVLVVRLRGLTLTNNHILNLTGDKPIIFLVSGNVLVDSGGIIDASATPGPTGGTTPGPGGNSSACGASTGGNGVAGSNGRGGGGGGFGTPGGHGGQNGGAGGAASASTNLQPLRGGCGGGTADPGPGGGGGAFQISASGTITIGTGTNSAVLASAGGGSRGASNTNDTPSSGAGSGGGILLVSPTIATFGTNGVARVHGGASGAGSNSSTAGQNGHTADNSPASGGTTSDGAGAPGVSGGLCAQNSATSCGVASAAGANGNSGAGGGASGGGGGGGRIQVTTGSSTTVCR